MARPKGTGSVFQRASNGRWYGQIEAGWTRTGARRYITVSAKTEAAAKQKLRAKQNEIARNGIPATSTGTATVKQWSQRWLPMYAKEARPQTYNAAASAVRRHILPAIGGKRLASLTPSDVRAVHAEALAGDNSSSTALRTHAVLVVMLKAAILEGHHVPPAALLVKRPKKAASTRDAIPLDEALALLRVAHQQPAGARWVAALLQGMRQAECLGMTWDCVDLAGGTLDISWQLQSLPYADRSADTFRIPDGYETRRLSGAFHLVRPKSARGHRIIPLVPWMTAALTGWRDHAPGNPWGLLWCEPGPRPTRQVTDRNAWYELQLAANVTHVAADGTTRPFTLHEARHTTATLLLEAGVDPEVIKTVMGHSSIVTTRGYQHVSQTMARQAMEGVAARLQLTAD